MMDLYFFKRIFHFFFSFFICRVQLDARKIK
jgi:hypothetical protein